MEKKDVRLVRIRKNISLPVNPIFRDKHILRQINVW